MSQTGSYQQSGGGGGGSTFTWNVITSATQGMTAQNGYLINTAGLCTLTLPATSSVGDTIQVAGINATGSWKINQNAGNKILIGSISSTTGATGYVSSTAVYDSITLVCVSGNANWVVTSSLGNLTVN